jgi:transcriptional regulator with XRE-family HTH domain
LGRRDTQGNAYKALVASLVEHRKSAGMTQVELARRMKTDQSQISKFERSERRLDVMDYLRYCESIGLDPGILLKEIVNARPNPRSGKKS